MKIDERNPITLRFNNKEQEFAYQYSNYPAKIQQIRVVFLLFIMLYSAFGLLDRHMAQEYTNIFLMIRFAVVIPVFVIILLSSFTKMFLKMHNFALLIAFIISGLGIAAMLVMVPTNLSYYGGLFMILYSGFFLIRLGFFHASIGAWVVFIGYVAGSFAINGVSGLDFLAMLFFYFFSIVIGMFGSYYIELFSRRDFIQKEMIAADKREMERRVSKRFQEISRAQEATLLALAKLAESRDIYTVDHVELGLNLGKGFGDLSNATENAVIVNGRVHKLDQVEFGYTSGDYMQPWHFTDNEDRLDLVFTPFKDRTATTNLAIITSEVHQMFGRYNGHVMLDDGSKLEIKDLIGFAEEHHARW